jgi:hypothetical protein
MKVRAAMEGVYAMSQSTLRRYLTVGVLAAILTTASAAPAQARDLGTAGRAWLWLQDVWTQGVSALWDWSGVAGPGSKGAPRREKQGHGMGSKGLPSPRPAPPSPVCDTCADQGPGFDPNG